MNMKSKRERSEVLSFKRRRNEGNPWKELDFLLKIGPLSPSSPAQISTMEKEEKDSFSPKLVDTSGRGEELSSPPFIMGLLDLKGPPHQGSIFGFWS